MSYIDILRIIDIVVALIVPGFMLWIKNILSRREGERSQQLESIKDLQNKLYVNSEKVNQRLTELEISTKVHDELLRLISSSLHISFNHERDHNG